MNGKAPLLDEHSQIAFSSHNGHNFVVFLLPVSECRCQHLLAHVCVNLRGNVPESFLNIQLVRFENPNTGIFRLIEITVDVFFEREIGRD